MAAIFAYVCNPIVNFLSEKIKFPRALSVVIIYLCIIGMLVGIGLVLSSRVIEESSQLTLYAKELSRTTQEQIQNLPTWLAPTAKETMWGLEKSKLFSPINLFNVFPQALSRVVSFILFLFSGFFFLKEGRYMLDRLLHFVPNDYKIEVEILLRRISAVLNGYLRGQLFLVFLVSLVLFIALSILGVRFALILAIFSGFAEIVPIVGPIVAASVAAIVVYFVGVHNFPFAPMQGALVTIIIYTVVRQLQDYFVTPYVMGKVTKLHPFIILFSVISGEHLLGVLGLILAVPIAAVIRILLEYSLDKINDHGLSKASFKRQ